MTCGMSTLQMNVPEGEGQPPVTMEIMAVSNGSYLGAKDGEDMIARTLQLMAAFPFTNGTFLAPYQTIKLWDEFGGDSPMNSFILAFPLQVDVPRLCSCTPGAQIVTTIMPISKEERELAVSKGSEALFDLFDEHKVSDLFDLDRKPVI